MGFSFILALWGMTLGTGHWLGRDDNEEVEAGMVP